MKLLRYAAGPVLLFLAWWAATTFTDVPAILLPSPQSVLMAFVGMLESGELASHIAASGVRALTGFVLAAAVGLSLGLVLSQSKKAFESADILINALRVTPPLALIPLLILWFGIEEAPKVAVVFLSGFFPIYLNTLNAFQSVDAKLLEVAASLRMTRKEVFRLVLWPAALPGILTGLRIGFGYCWRALVGAELIAASTGLGFMISESGEYMKTDCVFVGIITIAVLGIVMDNLLWFAISRTKAVSRVAGTKGAVAPRVHPQ